jgi:DNA helicase-2/ATP-dependent DNA helicase PcrA
MILTVQQQQVIECTDKHVYICGTPGSGKSEVLIGIVEKCIENGMLPDDIFVGSFSRRDSSEFASRLEAKLSHCDVTVRTIHSLCYHVVHLYMVKNQKTKYLNKMGGLNMITGKARNDLIDKAVASVDADDKLPPISRDSKGNIDIDYGRCIDLWKSQGVRPNKKEALACDKQAVYLKYQQMLAGTGKLDFGELLLKAETALKDEDVLAAYRYKAMILDECQDLSDQQVKTLEPLLSQAKMVRISADKFQSVYSFRGAIGHKVESRFRRIFPNMTKMELTENHRSKSAIVLWAETIFQRGMTTANDGGRVITMNNGKTYIDKKQHASDTFSIVKQWRDEGCSWGEIGILCRTRAAMSPVRDILTENDIPNVVGETPFTQTEACKDFYAWLEISHPASLLSQWIPKKHPFRRVYKAPRIQLTDADMLPIKNQDGNILWLGDSWFRLFSKQNGMLEDRLKPSLYPDRYARAIRILQGNINHVQTLDNPTDVLTFVSNVMKPAYSHYYHSLEIDRKLDNIQSLIDYSQEYSDTESFMKFLDRLDAIVTRNAVTLSTIHGSKGLEWNNVVLVNVPLPYADYDEERRIEYVGVSRAANEVAISSIALERR